MFCCNDTQRGLRGGRYTGMLRSLTNHPLITYELTSGNRTRYTLGARRRVVW